MDLIEFVNARLAGRAAWAARAQILRDMLDDPRREIDPNVRNGAEYAWREAVEEPAITLREVATMRVILGEYAKVAKNEGHDDVEYADGWVAALGLLVRNYAAIWTGHPDYDPAWAPDVADH